MAGHSKRHNIKHRKAAQDAKKSKIYANIAKLIQMAAKSGSDPSLNPSLEQALIKARQAGLPKHVIQKAIDKGSGKIETEELKEVFYEGYGTGGTALYIKCITSNTNRSASEIKATLSKYGGSMGTPGSVSRQFKEIGSLVINGKKEHNKKNGKSIQDIVPIDTKMKDELEADILETDAEDYNFSTHISQKEQGETKFFVAHILTSKDAFISTIKTLESQGWNIESSDLIFLAENKITLDTKSQEKLHAIINALEELSDVDTVRHNAQGNT